jgi:hypothetical protein
MRCVRVIDIKLPMMGGMWHATHSPASELAACRVWDSGFAA